MTPFRRAAPAKARPLAPVATLLVIAVTAYAALVGCGNNQDNTSTTTPGTTETPPVTTGTPDTSAGDASAVSLELGTNVYKQRCVLCHGPEGKGDGPGAAALNPKPRNHTDGTYMKSQTDEQLLEVLRNGKGQMPPWGKILSESEMRSVLMYVRTLAK